MTQIRMTKAEIIRAIEKEPVTRLRAGSWYDGSYDRRVSKTCSVCAVGAVMRSVVSPYERGQAILEAAVAAVRGAGDVESSRGVYENLRDERWMAALSSFFESTWRATLVGNDWKHLTPKQIEGVRTRAVAFVREYFPRSIVIDIDGAKPAKDVKVVKAR